MMNSIYSQQDTVALNSRQGAINHILELGRRMTVCSWDLIFKQGQVANATILIVEGEVETFEFDEILEMETNHRKFGIGQLLANPSDQGHHHHVNARALQSTALCVLDRDTTHALMDGSLPQSKYFFQLMRETLTAQTNTAAGEIRDIHSPVIDKILQRSKNAQASLKNITETSLDEVIVEIADRVNREAWSLAQQAILETGMGRLEHRIQKIMLGTLEVAASLKGKPGVGSLSIEADGVEKMLMPMGVILGLIPITNPVETLVFKVLIALKSRNAIVLSCHRDAKKVSRTTVTIIRRVLREHNVEEDIVQLPDVPIGRKVTQLLMRHKDMSFILATGGESVVQESYRSGTPSIGVGKGNAPVWVREDANLETAANMIVNSKAFDNGVVCGSENNIIVSRAVSKLFTENMVKYNAAVLTPEEEHLLIAHCFDTKGIQRIWLGKSAAAIAEHAGICRTYPIELLVCPVAKDDYSNLLLCEKLAPTVSLIEVVNDEEALALAQKILENEGRGHTAIIHSNDRQAIETFTLAVDVSRVLVNSPGTQGCIGACNGLQLSWTLGCGTGGGGSTSDNVGYEHLMNKKRLAFSH
ncbi:aldehyde dehydrogenase family protein [Reinekea sp.]|jgi:acetaldehyde dehydrogenase/alcohol dehydrogenase|uniref:aldehyde dehydrogenase family protein n=1 Tax=Reinekea sp. TaxID=1970455 RepID=UPI00398A2217